MKAYALQQKEKGLSIHIPGKPRVAIVPPILALMAFAIPLLLSGTQSTAAPATFVRPDGSDISLTLMSPPLETATATATATPTPSSDPEYLILLNMKNNHSDWNCPYPVGLPLHRQMGPCYPFGYFSHPTYAHLDNYGNAPAAQATWEAKRTYAQAYPTFTDVTYQGLPGYEAGDADYPYAHYENYFWGSAWVAGAESSDDTHFRGAPPVAHAVVDELIAYQGYQTVTPSPAITPSPISTGTPTVCPTLSGTGSGICSPGYLGIYSYSFDITNNGAQSTTGIVEVHLQISPLWDDWDTSGPYQYLFQPGTNHITGSFYEFGPPPSELSWRVLLHGVALDSCWTLDVYTPQYPVCTEATPGITPTSAATATATTTTSPTPPIPCDLFYMGSTFSCSAPDTYDYSFSFHTYDCQVSSNITTYFEVGPSDQGPWTDYDQRSEYHTFPTAVAGTFTEPGIPSEYHYARVMVAGVPPPAYGATTVPMLRCDLGTPGPTFTVTSTPPPPTPQPPDLTGSITWLPSCDIAHVVLLRTMLGGDPNGLSAGPSHMRMENRVGDHIDFPVPSLGGPNPTYYDYACSAGSCIPQSWQIALPYTLTVDIFNEVAETNEGNNVSVLGGPTPTPAPCIDTPTPGTRTPTVTATLPLGTRTPTVTATPTLCAIDFTDVLPGSTFYPYVHCLACQGVVSGYADGTFRPGNDVTRGQIAKIVASAAGLQMPPYPTPCPAGTPCPVPTQPLQPFADVGWGSLFYQYIYPLADQRIVTGYPCGGPGEPCGPRNLPYFRTYSQSTRGQLAKIDAKAAGYNGQPTTQTFADVPPSSPFYVWIEQLAERQIVGGYECGGPNEPCDEQNRPYFRPGNGVTRGQASKIISSTFFPNCQTPSKR